jgi:hypothetical protein
MRPGNNELMKGMNNLGAISPDGYNYLTVAILKKLSFGLGTTLAVAGRG